MGEAKRRPADQDTPQLEDGWAIPVATSGPDKQQLGPLREVLSQYPLAVLIGTLGTAAIGAFWYVPPVYGPQFMEKFAGLPPNAVALPEMVCYIIPTLLSPVVGVLVDNIGAGRVHLLSLVACVVAPLPLFYLYTHAPATEALAVLYIGEIMLGVLQALTSAVYLWTV